MIRGLGLSLFGVPLALSLGCVDVSSGVSDIEAGGVSSGGSAGNPAGSAPGKGGVANASGGATSTSSGGAVVAKGGGANGGSAASNGGTASGTGGAVSPGSGGSKQGGGAPGTGGMIGAGGASGGAPGTGGVIGAGGASGGSASGGTPGTSGSSSVNACGQAVNVNTQPFGCEFAWGTNGDSSRASYLDFITTWVGYEWSQGNEDGCDGCGLAGQLANTNATAVYYAYFAGYALPDCNVNPNGTNLCTDGAAWIRDNRQRYIDLYASYARRTYEASPNKGVVWLLEGDFVQYTYDEQSRPFSMAELGELATDVVCAIKTNEPNAIVAMNHSTWLADDVTNEFWAAMPLDILDMVWTTGVADNDGFLNGDTNPGSYNAATSTYRYLHALTGKGVWADTSFGLSQMEDSWTGAGAAALNDRIAEGAIGASVTDPPNDYQSRVTNLRPALAPLCQ